MIRPGVLLTPDRNGSAKGAPHLRTETEGQNGSDGTDVRTELWFGQKLLRTELDRNSFGQNLTENSFGQNLIENSFGQNLTENGSAEIQT